MNDVEKISKTDVSRSLFLFLVLFFVLLMSIPNFNNFSHLSTLMIIGKIASSLILVIITALNGTSFMYKLLSYFENRQESNKK